MILMSLISFLSGILYILVGIYSYRKAPRKSLTHVFLISCLLIFWWALSYTFLYTDFDTKNAAWTWYKLSLAGKMLLPALLLHFYSLLTRSKFLEKRWLSVLLYLPALFFMVYGFLHNLIITDFIHQDKMWWGQLDPRDIGFWMYLIYAFTYQLISLFAIRRWGKKIHSHKQVKQSRILILSIILTMIIWITLEYILPLLTIIPYLGLGHIIWGLEILGVWIAIHYFHLLKTPAFVNGDFIASRMSDMMMVLDEKGRIILTNNKIHEILGFSEDSLYQEKLSLVISDKSIIPHIMEKLMGNNPNPEFECSFLSRDGIEIPVKVSSSRHMDAFGDLVGFTFIAKDLRFQKDMENEIEERKRWEVEVRYAHHELKLKHKELEIEQNKLKMKNEMIDIELGMARKIQTELIPSESPIPNLAFFYKPMEKVGGDFYDFIQFEKNDKVGIFLSDVSGHGVPAAFITSMIKSHNLQYGKKFDTPSDFLHNLNDFLLNKTGENFITAFYAIFDRKTGDLYYSNAGHNSPFLIKRNSIKILPIEGRGIPLGILSRQELAHMSKPYTSHHIHLAHKNKVFLYTDGLSETTNIYDNERLFEAKEMMETMQEIRDLSPHSFVQKMFSQLSEFRQSKTFEDDICMICLEA